MDTKMLDDLKQRHAYEKWRASNTIEQNLFIWKFFLSGSEFPGWQIHRIQSVETGGWPPSIQSIWRRHEGETGALLSVDIFEHPSRTAAHEFLVQLLGEFQSPDVTRQEQITIGDVAFAGLGDAFLLFARANLVILIRNAGRDLMPISEVARQFDRDLVSRPEMDGAKVAPEIRRFESLAREFQVGVSVPLEVEASDPLERPLWYKFFSRAGEVLLKEGRLVYQPASAGEQEVSVFAINANRGTASQVLRLTVK